MEDTIDGQRYLFFEHMGNAAVRQGKWKLVRDWPRDWELYDMNTDRTETKDLSGDFPEITVKLRKAWKSWAKTSNILPWKIIQRKRNVRRFKQKITKHFRRLWRSLRPR